MTTHKRDKIKILESDNKATATSTGLTCINCNERHYFVTRPQDPTTVIFCTNCGHLTPTRQIKYNRGLMPPAGQQETALVQKKWKPRKPTTINDRRENELAKYLINRGLTVIDSQVTGP